MILWLELFSKPVFTLQKKVIRTVNLAEYYQPNTLFITINTLNKPEDLVDLRTALIMYNA